MFLTLVLTGFIGVALWLSLRHRRTGEKPKRSSHIYRPPGVSEVERYPTEPRTRPKQLSWRQREILSAASGGRLIFPVPSEDQAGAVSATHYHVQRRPVVALVRAGFLEYTPSGYRITESGQEALRRLPERPN
jgi:hypothetical protein